MIPNSVTRIQANAFQNPNSKQFNIYCQAESKPADWDSDWKYSNINVSFNQSAKFNYVITDEYAYCIVDNTSVKLLACYSKSKEIKVPRTINNLPVTHISSYCFSFDDTATIYIPSSVTIIDSYGVETTSSSKYVTVKCEVASKPSGWSTYAFYNMYNGSENYRFTIQYNQQLDY